MGSHQVGVSLMLNVARLSIAVEQVEVSATELGLNPLEAIAAFKKGNPTQRQIYEAIRLKHQPPPAGGTPPDASGKT